MSSSTVEKKPDYYKRIESAEKELDNIQNLYEEFREEILDSHRTVIESLRMPKMK